MLTWLQPGTGVLVAFISIAWLEVAWTAALSLWERQMSLLQLAFTHTHTHTHTRTRTHAHAHAHHRVTNGCAT